MRPPPGPSIPTLVSSGFKSSRSLAQTTRKILRVLPVKAQPMSQAHMSSSCLCDDGGENRQLYVPGSSRLSWNGVFSPDGASVAFTSKPKDGGAVDKYTMPLTGGDPVKAPTEFTLAEQLYCEEGDGSMLIDWK